LKAFTPSNFVVRPRPHRGAAGRRGRRRLHGARWRRRWCDRQQDGLGREGRARPAPAAGAPRRRHRRRRLGEDQRDAAPLLRALHPRLGRLGGAALDGARRGGGARSGRGTRGGARRGGALLGDAARHRAGLRRGTARRAPRARPRGHKDELGGAHIHARGSGAVDNEATDEDDALAQIRRFLSYLPNSVWELPPRLATSDDPERRDEELLQAIPRERRKPHDVRRIVALVMDAARSSRSAATTGDRC